MKKWNKGRDNKKKSKRKKVYTFAAFDRDALELPKIIIDCLAYLEEHGKELEGIFRLSGSQEEILKLKNSYMMGF
jgi:hypothetical protein